ASVSGSSRPFPARQELRRFALVHADLGLGQSAGSSVPMLSHTAGSVCAAGPILDPFLLPRRGYPRVRVSGHWPGAPPADLAVRCDLGLLPPYSAGEERRR